MAEKLEILKKYFVDGVSKKEISRSLHVSRNTVRAYINEYEQFKNSLTGENYNDYYIINKMLDKPKFNCSKRVKRVLTDEIKAILIEFINNNKNKIISGRSKMIMTAKDMYEELIDKGYQISYPTVVNFVRDFKENNQTHEAYIKQVYAPGEVCEFDWGDVKLNIDGKTITLKMAVFTLAYSNYRFAYLYHNENTFSFVDAHIRFFNHINGVPMTMVYDNMRVAVAKFVGRNEKEATEALKKMSIYYGFNYRFCNIRSGNEKGHVENSVEFIRRKSILGNG